MKDNEQGEILLSKEYIENHVGVKLTDGQYSEVAKAIFELASLIIETNHLSQK